MPTQKVVIIGAGSHFTPGLISDFIRMKDLWGSEIVLVDVDEARLEIMKKLSKRMVEKAGAELRIQGTTERQAVLTGADFVIVTIAIGGLEAWGHDVEIPLKYGIYQSVGDTVGPGGFFRALRVVPVILDICRDMETMCPEAWLINYSNPMTCNCLAISRHSKIKGMGLCHGIFGTTKMLADILEVNPEDLEVQAAGINHLTWILDLRYRDGENAYPRLRQKLESLGEIPFPVSLELFQLFGYFPSPGDRHVAEFFPFFLTEEADGGRKYGLEVWNWEKSAQGREAYWEKLSRQAEGEEPIDEWLRGESGEKAVNIISAMANNKSELHVVNIPNEGSITNLPPEAIVEISALTGSYGLRGICLGDLPKGIQGVLQSHIVKQELTVEAAVTGDRKIALQALILDPLIPSVEVAKTLLEEMLKVHAPYLPQFA